jgi:hypothetical protein
VENGLTGGNPRKMALYALLALPAPLPEPDHLWLQMPFQQRFALQTGRIRRKVPVNKGFAVAADRKTA